jgi:hypothetical protein
MADLGISDQEGQVYCYFDYSKTTDTTKHCICEGDEGCSQTKTQLKRIGSSGAFWLADVRKDSSCYGRNIGVSSTMGNIGSTRRFDASWVLCR